MQKFLQEKQLKQLFLTLILTYIDNGTLAWAEEVQSDSWYLSKRAKTVKPLHQYLKPFPVSFNNKLL